MTSPAMLFAWDGESMVPVGRSKHEADAAFVIGERYKLIEQQERSRASHAHYFASINDAWLNLPEEIAERFVTSEHLRKWALVKCGYRDERSIVCASKAEALRLAAFIKPMDEFAAVVVSATTVTVMTPKSQSLRAMGKADFAASKTAVLDYCASLVGVTPQELERNAAEAA